MKKFTEIEQFRNTIRSVKLHSDFRGLDESEAPIYRHDSPYPTLKFRGTCKIHGTNSSIVMYKDGHLEYQSRERVLSLQQDNAKFMLTMSNIDVRKLFEGIEFSDHVALYGEWAGGNIQKGVAITGLPLMWVLFALKVDDVYKDFSQYSHIKMEEQRIYNIYQFENYEIDIDFNYPEIAQNKLVEITEAVEKECPVGKYFGKSGIGEGVVWESITDDSRYIFKVKGEKHSISKVKTVAAIDVEELQGLKDFVEYAVTENRMKQGIDKMIELGLPLNMKSTGEYLRWVYNDIIKEENDVIVKNQIDPKKIGSLISAKARIFWQKHLDSLEM
jgi:hypothetical protein